MDILEELALDSDIFTALYLLNPQYYIDKEIAVTSYDNHNHIMHFGKLWNRTGTASIVDSYSCHSCQYRYGKPYNEYHNNGSLLKIYRNGHELTDAACIYLYKSERLSMAYIDAKIQYIILYEFDRSSPLMDLSKIKEIYIDDKGNIDMAGIFTMHSKDTMHSKEYYGLKYPNTESCTIPIPGLPGLYEYYEEGKYSEGIVDIPDEIAEALFRDEPYHISSVISVDENTVVFEQELARVMQMADKIPKISAHELFFNQDISYLFKTE